MARGGVQQSDDPITLRVLTVSAATRSEVSAALCMGTLTGNLGDQNGDGVQEGGARFPAWKCS
ncbi:MAG: hypothetical protein ACLVJB_07605 [Christensenellales bacterium]